MQYLKKFLEVSSAGWSYDDSASDGPANWGQVNANCNGARQSPINLNIFDVDIVRSGPKLQVRHSKNKPSSITYTNDGHGAAITFAYDNGKLPYITGGPLGKEKYNLYAMHMHWQSEHTLNNHHFDAEMHIVHFNAKYGNIQTAIQNPDGLAVLGIFYYVG